MGLDLEYQALPPDCPALQRAIGDPAYWENFSMLIPARNDYSHPITQEVIQDDPESRALINDFHTTR